MQEHEPLKSNSFEAEQILLGSLLVDPGLLDEIHEQVSVADFSDSGHAQIYNAISVLYNKWRNDTDLHSKINVLSISAFLHVSKANPGGIGPSGDYYEGSPYVMDLINIPLYSDVHTAIAQVKVSAAVKRAQRLALEVAKVASSVKPGATAGEVDDAVATVVMEYSANVNVSVSSAKSMTEHTDILIAQTTDMMERRQRGEIVDIGTGIEALDANITSGFILSDLVFLAADPGGKKSLTAQFIADHVASLGHGVLFFSTEMLGTQMVARRLAPETGGVQARSIRSGDINGYEWEKVMIASEKTKCDWFIVDDQTYDAGRMLSTIKRTKRKLEDMGHPLRLIFVDYLQMLSGSGREYSDDRRLEIDRILVQLRQVANSVAPVIILSQFNRTGVPGQRPTMRMAAETSLCEKIASFFILLWNQDGKTKFGFDKARDGVAPFDGEMPPSYKNHAWFAYKPVPLTPKADKYKEDDTDVIPAF